MAARPLNTVAILQLWTDEARVPAIFDLADRTGLDRHYRVARKVFVPPALPRGAVKRMSLLERVETLSPNQFRRIWKRSHGPQVASRAGALLGYCQNHVLDRSPAAPPCDGLTELWFPDQATMDEVLPPAPSAPEALTAQAQTFIGRISTLMMQEVCLK